MLPLPDLARLALQLSSGALILALGLAALAVRPRSASSLSFAVFAGSFGVGFVVANGASLLGMRGEPAYVALQIALRVVLLGGLVALAVSFPRPLARSERRLLAWPVALGLAWVAAATGIAVTAPAPARVPVLDIATYWVALGGMYAFELLLARRAAVAEDPLLRRQLALTCGALVLYTGFVATAGPFGSRRTSLLAEEPFFAYGAWVGAISALLVSLAWLRARDATLGRNMALLCALLPAAGIVAARAEDSSFLLGGLRVVAVLVLAYAILRHRLLGIDVKLRWGIARGTVAGVLLGAFFVASEAAQEFFSDSTQSAYLGIAATGALVFALAPIQRVAERLAERAIPHTATAEAARGKEEAYRAALRFALRDRALTPAEEIELAHLADELGISARRATQLRLEVATPPHDAA